MLESFDVKLECTAAVRPTELGSVAANCILHSMTRALDAAIAKLSELPAEEQDRIARWLLDELGDEELWARQFAASQDALGKLAAEARRTGPQAERRSSIPTSCEIARDAAVLGGVSRSHPRSRKPREGRSGCSVRTPATQASSSRRSTIATLSTLLA